MNYAMIFNGSSRYFPQKARQMRAFIEANLKDRPEGESIIFHDENITPKDLAGNIFTAKSTWARLRENNPETVLKVLPDLCRRFDLILMTGDYYGEELAIRLALRLKGSALVSALNFDYQDDRLLSEKMVYSQHLKAAFELQKKPYCLAMARGFEEVNFDTPVNPAINEIDYSNISSPGFIISQKTIETTENDSELDKAKCLVVAGRGVGGPEGAKKAGDLAKVLDGQLGVTRPVAMNAWAPMNKLVGVSGAMTRPELSLVFGASGAAAFYAGIAKSKIVVSVDRDPGAAIIRQSDAAIIDDGPAVMDELLKVIERQNHG